MPNGQDMKWVLEYPQLGERRTRVLSLFVEYAKQEDLEAAFGEREMAADTLDIFMRNIDEYKIAAARMVVLPTLTPEKQVEQGLRLYAHLEPSERQLVGQCIAGRILSDAGKRNTKEIEAALNTVLPDIHVLKLIDEVFGVEREGAVVSELLERIEEFTAETRSFLEKYGARIVELLAGRDKFDLTASGALSLTRLMVRTKSRAMDMYIQMCCTVLPFALSGHDMPASPVIVEAFPTVHNGLEGEREYFGLLHMFMLSDWDRARTLRKELVRAYMESDWPPVDLAVAGLKAQALGRILKRVIKEPGGAHYLDQIEEGVKDIKKDVRGRILRKIKEARKTNRFVFESET